MSTQQQTEMTVSSIQQEWRVHPNNCIICETRVSIVVDVPKINDETAAPSLIFFFSFFFFFFSSSGDLYAAVIGPFVCAGAAVTTESWRLAIQKNTCYSFFSSLALSWLLDWLFWPFPELFGYLYNLTDQRTNCNVMAPGFFFCDGSGGGGCIMSSRWAVDEEDLSSNRDRRLVWKAIRSDSERVSTLYKRSTLLAEPPRRV